ncbi:hypothetical protein GCM10022254_16730 [Actinomadura meridiana]|uniref:Uncharacterized protein n=1 Tax=Actinomadura meridiana TaxID=559626 RepID=A0ABP8BVS9_9ACTN
MDASPTPGPAMTARKRRGLEIDAREAKLEARRGEFDRERSRIFRVTSRKPGGKQTWSDEERAVRAELRALADERAALLARIEAELAELRPRQSEFDRLRAEARAAGSRKKPPVTKKEQKLRNRVALLQSERAHLDGTVRRDRESSRHEEAVWNTVLDATSDDSSYW